ADPRAPLLAEVSHHPQPERHGQHSHPDQRGHHRDQRELDLVEAPAPEHDHTDTGDHERRPGEHPYDGTYTTVAEESRDPRTRTVPPAAALRLVGLAPHDGRTDDRGRERHPHP